MITLLTPKRGETVTLLRPGHLEYIQDPITDPDAARKIEWLNLKASGEAAGRAAAIAAAGNYTAATVPVSILQAALRQNGGILSPAEAGL